MFKHNLTAVLNLQRENKNGMYALRLRTTIQRSISYYPTGISLKVNQWDSEKKEVVNHPLKDKYNSLIRKKMVDLETELIEAARKGEPLKKAKKKQHTDFILFCEAKIKEQQRTDKYNTTRHKKADLNILRGFREPIPFEALSVKLLHQFEDYCAKKLNNNDNTIWGHMKFIKGMMRQAVGDGLLDAKILTEYKMPKYIDPEREFLVLEEVDKIEQFRDGTGNEKLRKVADWFLFSCYSGMRYEDVRTFSREKIRMDKIILRTSKKGIDTTLAIHPRLQKVIDRMQPGVYSNQKCNDYLKLIAAGSGINKDISMHIGRHSFAVIFLELGGTMEGLSKILAHTKISTTLIYGKITNRRLDEEMKKVWG